MIKITKTAFSHKDGTKDYDIYCVTCDETGMGAVINRWGRVGSFGQIKQEVFTDTRAKREAQKGIRTRESRGYSIADQTEQSFVSRDEIASFMGAVWSKASESILQVIGDDDAHFAAPEPTMPVVPPKEIIRPESWGSW